MIVVEFKLVVAASPAGDDVLPRARVQRVEFVAEDQLAAVVVEIAPQLSLHRRHDVHQQHFQHFHRHAFSIIQTFYVLLSICRRSN